MSPYGKEKTQLSRNEIVVFFHSKLNDIAHRGSISKIRPTQIFEILSKHLSPIRPWRQYKRYQSPVSAVAFQYRFS